MVLLGLGTAKQAWQRMGGRPHVGSSSLWQAWRKMAAIPPTQGTFPDLVLSIEDRNTLREFFVL